MTRLVGFFACEITPDTPQQFEAFIAANAPVHEGIIRDCKITN